jgi:hypothetical protein
MHPGPLIFQVSEQESEFGAPIGVYQAWFRGVDQRQSHGLEWRFEIDDAGPWKGKIVSRATGRTPSPKNACSRILSGLIGRPLKEGDQVDIGPCLNRRYTITVENNSCNTGTRVGTVLPPVAAAPAGNGGAVRHPTSAEGVSAAGSPVFEVWDSRIKQPVRKSEVEIQRAIDTLGIPPEKIQMRRPGQVGAWQSAAAFGFRRCSEPDPENLDTIPF